MTLDFRVAAFNRPDFEAVLMQSSRLDAGAVLPAQAIYLSVYLASPDMGAKTMVIESPYIDRHFLAEYQGYYATTLATVPRATTRIHLFSCPFTKEAIFARLSEGSESRASAKAELESKYIGFIVVRPLPSAPIGRTVLKRYESNAPRVFGPRRPTHLVHLWGLTLGVEGFPFQQQDQAVGACATTAIWCAVVAAYRRDGGRSPTPLAITDAANRSLPVGRSLPANGGLSIDQIVAAVNAMGYSPDVFKAGHSMAEFQVNLTTYLRSGIPVIVVVREEGTREEHAVALVGFKESDGAEGAGHIEYRARNGTTVRFSGACRYYLHDDRLGPNARVESVVQEDDQISFRFVDQHRDLAKFTSAPLVAWTVIAPLYPKIRMSAVDLLYVAVDAYPLAKWLASASDEQMRLELSYSLSGEYSEHIYARVSSGVRAVQINSSAILSRYVGIIRYFADGVWLLDVICDVTDVYRETPRLASVLVMIPADEGLVEMLNSRLSVSYPRVRAM